MSFNEVVVQTSTRVHRLSLVHSLHFSDICRIEYRCLSPEDKIMTPLTILAPFLLTPVSLITGTFQRSNPFNISFLSTVSGEPIRLTLIFARNEIDLSRMLYISPHKIVCVTINSYILFRERRNRRRGEFPNWSRVRASLST